MHLYFPPTSHDEQFYACVVTYAATLPLDKFGNRAYAERDEMHPGVCLRSITHYDVSLRTQIITDLEHIYETIITDTDTPPSTN